MLKYHSDYFMELTNSIALPDWFAVEEKDTNQVWYSYSIIWTLKDSLLKLIFDEELPKKDCLD